ncbi:SDR family NAD(P)-dependent oxidoreductase [Rhizobium sp. OAE497]|uniref:SDR family NAD(P)-dependent oxidoreductase n=1 Tax=unclassified Rhizobium TaxID=2613769 RepID=UPI000DD629F1
MGLIDVLINNHGSFPGFSPSWNCDPVFEIILRGTFNTCRTAGPMMLAQGSGRIVKLVGGGTGNIFRHGWLWLRAQQIRQRCARRGEGCDRSGKGPSTAFQLRRASKDLKIFGKVGERRLQSA